MAIQLPGFGISKERPSETGPGVRTDAVQKSFLPNASPISTGGIVEKLDAIANQMTANNDRLLIAEHNSNFQLQMGEFQTNLDPDQYSRWAGQVEDFSTDIIAQTLAAAREAGVSEDGLELLSTNLKVATNSTKLAVMKTGRTTENVITKSRVTNNLNKLAQTAQGKSPDSPEGQKARLEMNSLLSSVDHILTSPEIVEQRHSFNVLLEEEWLTALDPAALLQLPDDAFRFTMRRDELQANARIELAKVHKGFFNATGDPRVLMRQLAGAEITSASLAVRDSVDQANNHPEPWNTDSVTASITANNKAFDNLAALLASSRSLLTPAQINAAERVLEGRGATTDALEFKHHIAISPDLDSLKAVEEALGKSLGPPGQEGAQIRGQRVLRQFEPGLRSEIKERRDLLTDVLELQDVEDNPNAFTNEEKNKRHDKLFDRFGVNIANAMFTPQGNINEEVVQGVVNLARQLRFVDDRVVTYLVKTIQDRDPEKDNIRGNAVIVASLLKTAGNNNDIDKALDPVQNYLIHSRSMARVPMQVGADVRVALEVASDTSELSENFLIKQATLMEQIEEIEDISKKLGWSEQGDTLFRSLGKELVGIGTILESTPGIKDRVLGDYKYLARTIQRNNPSLSIDEINRRALDIIKNAYRVSHILGKPQVMINPPESPRFNYGGIEATSEIQEDIFKTIKDFFNAGSGDTPPDGTYEEVVRELILTGEGVRRHAYSDTSKIPSIGKGFNLTDPLVKKTVIAMVGEADYQQMLTDADQKDDDAKKVSLTDKRINKIFETVIKDKEATVAKWYAGTDLTPVQRAVIVDLAYQGGSLFVGPNTDFYRAVRKGDWPTAINEVRNRSNLNNVQGIQNRMDRRSNMLEQSLRGVATGNMWPEDVRKKANSLYMKDPTLQTQEGPSSALNQVQLTYAGVDKNQKPQWRLSFMNRYVGLYRPEERHAKASDHTVKAAQAIQAVSNVGSIIKPGPIPTKLKWMMNFISDLTGIQRPEPSAEGLLGTTFDTESVPSTHQPQPDWMPPTVRRPTARVEVP